MSEHYSSAGFFLRSPLKFSVKMVTTLRLSSLLAPGKITGSASFTYNDECVKPISCEIFHPGVVIHYWNIPGEAGADCPLEKLLELGLIKSRLCVTNLENRRRRICTSYVAASRTFETSDEDTSVWFSSMNLGALCPWICAQICTSLRTRKPFDRRFEVTLSPCNCTTSLT